MTDTLKSRQQTLLPALALGLTTLGFIIAKTGRDALFFQDSGGLLQLPLIYINIGVASLPLAIIFVKAMKIWGARPARLGVLTFAAAVMARGLWPCLCDIQRCDDVRGAGILLALRQIQSAPARPAAAFRLRHFSRALHLHHLAAIRGLRSAAARVCKVRDRVHLRAVTELVAHSVVAEGSVRGADDLAKFSRFQN